MRREPAKEHAIAALADEQHGVVARAQLLSAGLTNQDVDRRLKAIEETVRGNGGRERRKGLRGIGARR